MKAPEQTEDKLEYERGTFITVAEEIAKKAREADTEAKLKDLWFDMYELSGACMRLAYQLQAVGRRNER